MCNSRCWKKKYFDGLYYKSFLFSFLAPCLPIKSTPGVPNLSAEEPLTMLRKLSAMISLSLSVAVRVQLFITDSGQRKVSVEVSVGKDKNIHKVIVDWGLRDTKLWIHVYDSGYRCLPL